MTGLFNFIEKKSTNPSHENRVGQPEIRMREHVLSRYLGKKFKKSFMLASGRTRDSNFSYLT